jgi:hypothetical protein
VQLICSRASSAGSLKRDHQLKSASITRFLNRPSKTRRSEKPRLKELPTRHPFKILSTLSRCCTTTHIQTVTSEQKNRLAFRTNNSNLITVRALKGQQLSSSSPEATSALWPSQLLHLSPTTALNSVKTFSFVRIFSTSSSLSLSSKSRIEKLVRLTTCASCEKRRRLSSYRLGS